MKASLTESDKTSLNNLLKEEKYFLASLILNVIQKILKRMISAEREKNAFH